MNDKRFSIWKVLRSFFGSSESVPLEEVVLSRLIEEADSNIRETIESQFRELNNRRREPFDIAFKYKEKPGTLLFENQKEIFKLFSVTIREKENPLMTQAYGTVYSGYLSMIRFRSEIAKSKQRNGDWEVVDLKIYTPPKASPSERRLEMEKVADILGTKPDSVELCPSKDVYANLVDFYEASLNAEHLEFLRVCGGADLEVLTLRGIGDLQFFPSSPAIVVGDVADGLLIWHEGCYREWCFDGSEQRVLTGELKSSIQLLKS